MPTNIVPLDFATYRHYYLRVTSEAQNRLTISTFLGGLTFASFAALLTATSISQFTAATIVPAIVDVLLGAATFLFLLTTASTYSALQHVAKLSPTAVKDLGGDPPAPGTLPPVLNPNDIDRLTDAFNSYEEPKHFIPIGLGLVLLSLLLIGFQINWGVGIITTIIFVVVLFSVRTLVRTTFDTLRGRSSRNP